MSAGTRPREPMSPQLSRVMERAKRIPDARFHSLAHLLDEGALKRAYHELRNRAAVGVDGVTKEQYGQQLEENIRQLHARLKARRYRHQPIQRRHIPKESGQTRPIGVSCVEDKIVQGAIREVLEAIYEQDFLPCSYGFRPRRSAHDALRAVDRMVFREGIQWILEADIQAFFDSLDRTKLKEMLQIRVVDGALLRLIGKCLHVGVLDGEQFQRPTEGTAQGSSLSPLLGNLYLHYALDRWFEDEVRPRLRGPARLIRYADDFVMGFTHREDAEQVLQQLDQRLEEHGLKLHPTKTRLIPFGRPPAGQRKGKGPATFDFLGFTVHWCRSRSGLWRLGMKTRKARLRKAIRALHDFCRSHRHEPRRQQHATLSQKLRGHYQYFGINGNHAALDLLHYQAERAWGKWLQRRSQRRRLTWERYRAYLRAYPLPIPRILHTIWGCAP